MNTLVLENSIKRYGRLLIASNMYEELGLPWKQLRWPFLLLITEVRTRPMLSLLQCENSSLLSLVPVVALANMIKLPEELRLSENGVQLTGVTPSGSCCSGKTGTLVSKMILQYSGLQDSTLAEAWCTLRKSSVEMN